MAGLLGNGWDDPQSAAIMALAGGLLQGNFGAGLLGANNAYTDARTNALKEKYMQAQMANIESETLARKQKADLERLAMERDAKRLQMLPGLFKQPGMTGGEVAPQMLGDIPMFSKPVGVTPMQATPGGFDVQGAVRAGFKPEDIEKYFKLTELGLPEVARTVEGVDAQGRPVTYQYDKRGQQIGQPVPKWVAPHFANLGNETVGIDPVTMQKRGAFPMSMSPSERDASSRGWAGHNLSVQRFNAEQNTPQYMQTDQGIVALPKKAAFGTPINAQLVGGTAPTTPKLTEDQGKATGWLVQASTAWDNMRRVAMDDKGNIKSAARPGINDAIATIPSFGASEAIANSMRSKDRQQFMQASSSLSEALLRAATGAGVNKDEAAQKIREITPVAGDSDAVIQQKMAAIPLYLETLKVRAGPGAPSATSIMRQAQPTTRASAGAVGVDPSDPLGLRR